MSRSNHDKHANVRLITFILAEGGRLDSGRSALNLALENADITAARSAECDNMAAHP